MAIILSFPNGDNSKVHSYNPALFICVFPVSKIWNVIRKFTLQTKGRCSSGPARSIKTVQGNCACKTNTEFRCVSFLGLFFFSTINVRTFAL